MYYSMLVNGEVIASSSCREIIVARAKKLVEFVRPGLYVSVWDCTAGAYILSMAGVDLEDMAE